MTKIKSFSETISVEGREAGTEARMFDEKNVKRDIPAETLKKFERLTGLIDKIAFLRRLGYTDKEIEEIMDNYIQQGNLLRDTGGQND